MLNFCKQFANQTILTKHNIRPQQDTSTTTQQPNDPLEGKSDSSNITIVLNFLNELATQVESCTDAYCGKFVEEHGTCCSLEIWELYQRGLVEVSER